MKTKQAATELTPQGQCPRAKASEQNPNCLVFLQEEGLSQASYQRNQTLPAASAAATPQALGQNTVHCHLTDI